MASEAQAKIFRKLYVKTVNQDHVQKWAMGLEHPQASQIISRIIKLNRDLSLKNPEEHIAIQEWGRAQCKALGYEEPQFNKTI